MVDQRFITFAVNDRVYGLPALDVHEVIRMVSLVAVPCPPGGLAGLLNLRGELIPVLDLRWPFGDPAVPQHPDQHLLVVSGSTKPMALLTDRALDLIAVDPDEIVPPEVSDVTPGVIGVTQSGDRPVTLLAAAFLSHQLDLLVRQIDGEGAPTP